MRAAALSDILTTLRRRWPAAPVVLYPASVQGDGAAAEIAQAIATANARADVDVLIVARGGGSIEDLWAFNEEIVARAVLESAIPVVSGVGHETDFTICDFTADVRAPTPTGAATLAVPDRRAVQTAVAGIGERLAPREPACAGDAGFSASTALARQAGSSRGAARAATARCRRARRASVSGPSQPARGGGQRDARAAASA